MKKFVLSISLLSLACLSGAAHAESCKASWYGPGFNGKTMANGKRFDMRDPKTVAHKTLPLGTRVLIVNKETGDRLVAVVRDRGPYEKGRCVDVTSAGADELNFRENGIAAVSVSVL